MWPKPNAMWPYAPRANAGPDIAALVARLQAVQPTLMVLEAPGGYQWAVVAALAAARLPLVVVHPCQARDCAKATHGPRLCPHTVA